MTLHDVKRIKELLLEGYANVQVAHLMGCSPETVGRIKRGAAHAGVHVPGDEALRPAWASGGVGEMRTSEVLQMVTPRHEAAPMPALSPEDEAEATEMAHRHARILREERKKQERAEAATQTSLDDLLAMMEGKKPIEERQVPAAKPQELTPEQAEKKRRLMEGEE